MGGKAPSGTAAETSAGWSARGAAKRMVPWALKLLPARTTATSQVGMAESQR